MWKLEVPDNLYQKWDLMTCIKNKDNNLTVGEKYRNIGYTSMGDKMWVFDDNKELNVVPVQCFINV